MSDATAAQRLRRAMELSRRVREIPPQEVHRCFDYDTRRLPHPLLARHEKLSAGLGDAVARTGASLGYPGWNLLYYCLLCALRSPRVTILETGTNLGFSTIVLAQALRDSRHPGRVHTVEISPDHAAQARRNLEEADLADLVELHLGDSLEVLPDLLPRFDGLDFAFLDGDHSAAHVTAELDCVLPLVRRAGGSVFFDNAGGGGVAEVLEQIRGRHGGSLVHFPNCSWGPPGAALWQP